MNERRTAIVTIRYPEATLEDQLQLDPERPYPTQVRIDDGLETAQEFHSPFGEHKWRQAERELSRATCREADGQREHDTFRTLGNELFRALLAVSPALGRFLAESSGPRRLVIASDRPEIHALPWEAMLKKGPGWPLLAQDEVSIVRSWGEFSATPHRVPDSVKLIVVTGPETRGGARRALERLGRAHPRWRSKRVEILEPDSAVETLGLPESEFSVVSIEAHGKRDTTEIVLRKGWGASAENLAAQLGRRTMVLLWSCYSGRPKAAGRPAAAAFHERADLVLAHQTPLHKDSCAEIADRFFEAVLRSDATVDPETAIVRERATLYTTSGRRTYCEWASLVVWMRRPVDLSPAVQQGRRLPRAAFVEPCDVPMPQQLTEAIDSARRHRRPRLHASDVPRPIPLWGLDDVPGAVIYADGTGSFEAGGDVRAEIEGPAKGGRVHDPDVPSTVHCGDGLLASLDFMARHRDSLLIWANTGPAERDVLDLIDLPRHVAVLFVDAVKPTDVEAEVDYERLSKAGRYEEAEQKWHERLEEGNGRASYWCAGFRILVRRERYEDAKECIRRLRDLGEALESLLLEANLEQRFSRRLEARRLYDEARSLAAERPCDRGRVAQELAYLAYEEGEFVEAEGWYQEAIECLDQGPPSAPERRELWADALGRALRDYAEVLVNWSPPRCTEAQPKLRRAMAIHGLDRRESQIAACLETRGTLRAAEGDLGGADDDLLRAADMLHRSGNVPGWVRVTRRVASLAAERGHRDKAGGILGALFEKIKQRATLSDRRTLAGEIALDRARIAWRSGDLLGTREWAGKSMPFLTEDSGPFAEAERLHNQARALLPE